MILTRGEGIADISRTNADHEVSITRKPVTALENRILEAEQTQTKS